MPIREPLDAVFAQKYGLYLVCVGQCVTQLSRESLRLQIFRVCRKLSQAKIPGRFRAIPANLLLSAIQCESSSKPLILHAPPPSRARAYHWVSSLTAYILIAFVLSVKCRCPSLRRLWLFSNRIAAMEGLHHCGALCELWLHDNRITAVAGVQSLVHLQVRGMIWWQ